MKAIKTKSVIVLFKSPVTRDHIINKKRIKRDLSAKEVFSTDMTTNWYVNEFLPFDTYALLIRTRAKANDLCYNMLRWKQGKS